MKKQITSASSDSSELREGNVTLLNAAVLSPDVSTGPLTDAALTNAVYDKRTKDTTDITDVWLIPPTIFSGPGSFDLDPAICAELVLKRLLKAQSNLYKFLTFKTMPDLVVIHKLTISNKMGSGQMIQFPHDVTPVVALLGLGKNNDGQER